LVGKPEEKNRLEDIKSTSEDNIKMYIKETRYTDEDWADRLGTVAKEQGNDPSGSKNNIRIPLLTERLTAYPHELCSKGSATPRKRTLLPAFASEFIKHELSGYMTSCV
jgi:hypothetical protein